MLRDTKEYFVFAIFWTIFGVVLATLATTYRDSFFNFLSFLIVFFSTYYYVKGSKADAGVTKSLGLLAGIIAIAQGIYVALALVFANVFSSNEWIIPALSLAPSLTVAAITAAVYLVSGVGMIQYRKEFFVLAILWTVLEAALAIADSSFTRSHFNIISILILVFATYHYFAREKAR
jgi:hypothetical protein